MDPSGPKGKWCRYLRRSLVAFERIALFVWKPPKDHAANAHTLRGKKNGEPAYDAVYFLLPVGAGFPAPPPNPPASDCAASAPAAGPQGCPGPKAGSHAKTQSARAPFLDLGQNHGTILGVDAPPILVYFSGDWDVHRGYGFLTQTQVSLLGESGLSLPWGSQKRNSAVGNLKM